MDLLKKESPDDDNDVDHGDGQEEESLPFIMSSNI